VGTGFSRATARELWERLHQLKSTRMPFTKSPERSDRDVRWVEPQLVAEVEFRGWTGDLLLRHASFRGLRDDKPAEEIVREVPDGQAAAESAPSEPAPPELAKKPARRRQGGAPAVRLTHPDRVYWPEDGITKQGLADYYADVWKWLAPHVVARP
ncbi:ATP dependent DNA ligase, partial [Geminicoccus flavidas]